MHIPFFSLGNFLYDVILIGMWDFLLAARAGVQKCFAVCANPTLHKKVLVQPAVRRTVFVLESGNFGAGT